MVIVEGDSMYPAISSGDLGVYMALGRYRNGSIIVYVPTRTGLALLDSLMRPVIIHRIVDIVVQSDGVIYYRTRGDNNQFNDPGLVRSDQVLGSVIGVIPKVGLALLFMKSPQGLVTIMGVLVFYYVARQDRKLGEERERSRLRASLAEMVLRQAIPHDVFARATLAIDFADEIHTEGLADTKMVTLADWIRHGGLKRGWVLTNEECIMCHQPAPLIKGANDSLINFCSRH